MIWMDVDLYSSAKDVMLAFDKLDSRGAIFSHECNDVNYKAGAIDPREVMPDNVVPAIVEAYRAARRVPTGRFVFGNTGSFWAKGSGFPVLPSECLARLVSEI